MLASGNLRFAGGAESPYADSCANAVILTERELQFFVFLVLIWIISCYICWDVGRFCTVKLAAEITRERTVAIEIDGCAVLV